MAGPSRADGSTTTTTGGWTCSWSTTLHGIQATEPFCGEAERKYRTYCHPKYYKPLANTLYHNNGDGTFTDVSDASGIAQHAGKGMAVVFSDYDGDGRIDAFVTNDTTPNFLFHNEGGGKFREVGLTAGVAMNDDGRALSSMGADFRDINNDGRDDLLSRRWRTRRSRCSGTRARDCSRT